MDSEWKHLRTSNVIESPFATVRLRQRVTKGAGSRTKGLPMAYKLLDMAQARWPRPDGAHLLPLVRAGIIFPGRCAADDDGAPAERSRGLNGCPNPRENRPLSELVEDADTRCSFAAMSVILRWACASLSRLGRAVAPT